MSLCLWTSAAEGVTSSLIIKLSLCRESGFAESRAILLQRQFLGDQSRSLFYLIVQRVFCQWQAVGRSGNGGLPSYSNLTVFFAPKNHAQLKDSVITQDLFKNVLSSSTAWS
uniref:Uncharacterized protein n=1 Tax=Schistocephalus solidus TaxID=70667 RepID=A0A0X3NIG6_SCHSO